MNKRRDSGFTLIELLVVIAIAAIAITALIAGLGLIPTTAGGASWSGKFDDTSDRFIPTPGGKLTLNYVVTCVRVSDKAVLSPEGRIIEFTAPTGCTVSPASGPSDEFGIIKVTVTPTTAQGSGQLKAKDQKSGKSGKGDTVNIEWGPQPE